MDVRTGRLAVVGLACVVAAAVVIVVLHVVLDGGPAPTSDDSTRPVVSPELDDVVARAAAFGPRHPSTQIWAADLVAARAAAGLPSDADPLDYSEDPSVKRARVASTILVVAPALMDFAGDPLADAVDREALQAIATTTEPLGSDLTVMRTDQDFEEVAQDLLDDGFERNGSVLSRSEGGTPPGVAHVASGDGLIAATHDPDGAERVALAVTNDPPATELAQRAADLAEGAAALGLVPDPSTCMSAWGVTERYDGTGGDLVLFAVDDPSEIEVLAHGRRRWIEFGEPDLESDRVVVPADSSSAFGLMDGGWGPGQLWRCAG